VASPFVPHLFQKPSKPSVISVTVGSLPELSWNASRNAKYASPSPVVRAAATPAFTSPDAAATLIRLATSVIGYHDTPPYAPGEIQRRAEMRQLIDILRPALDDVDALEVKRLLPDVVGDTTETGKAASRLRVILANVGKATYEVAIKVLTDIASETAKKVLGLKP
jgi:hypothetical protein